MKRYTIADRKAAIICKCLELGRRVSQSVPEERAFYSNLSGYINPNSPVFDPKFKQTIDKLFPLAPKYTTEEVKRTILTTCEKLGRRLKKSDGPLYQRATEYISPSCAQYDPEFRATLSALYPTKLSSKDNKVEVMRLCVELGRRPSIRIPEEMPLFYRMSNYTTPSSPSYDLKFKQDLENIYPMKSNPVGKKKAILSLIVELGRKPRKTQPAEAALALNMNSYLYPSNTSYDPEFKRAVDKLCSNFSHKRGL